MFTIDSVCSAKTAGEGGQPGGTEGVKERKGIHMTERESTTMVSI
jgi:hypothetical protein